MAALVLGTAFPSPAEEWEQRLKMKDLPDAVKKTVLEVSRGVKLRALTREVEKGGTFYEAELEVKGRIRDVIMDSTGAIVLIEEEVDWEFVPAAVRVTMEREAKGRKIRLVESLTRNNKIEAYEAHLRRGFLWEIEIKVDPDGNLIVEK